MAKPNPLNTSPPTTEAVLVPEALIDSFGRFASSRETAEALYFAIVGSFGTEVEFDFRSIKNDDGNISAIDMRVSKLGQKLLDRQLLPLFFGTSSNLLAATLLVQEGELVLVLRIGLSVSNRPSTIRPELSTPDWCIETVETSATHLTPALCMTLGVEKHDIISILKSLASGIYHENNIMPGEISCQPLPRYSLLFTTNELSVVDLLRHGQAIECILPRLSFSISTCIPNNNVPPSMGSQAAQPSRTPSHSIPSYSKLFVTYQYQRRPSSLFFSVGNKRKRPLSASEAYETLSKRHASATANPDTTPTMATQQSSPPKL